jgi:hypothetical protein
VQYKLNGNKRPIKQVNAAIRGANCDRVQSLNSPYHSEHSEEFSIKCMVKQHIEEDVHDNNWWITAPAIF